MTREEMICILKELSTEDFGYTIGNEAIQMAIQALSQEPDQLLIIRSNVLMHHDTMKKWIDTFKREKEEGIIILQPYFEPLLVPDNIKIQIVEPQGGEENMKITSIICDRCGKECEEYRNNNGYRIYNVRDDRIVDLCQKCYNSIAIWMDECRRIKDDRKTV